MGAAPSTYCDGLFQLTCRLLGVEIGTSSAINLSGAFTAVYNSVTKAFDVGLAVGNYSAANIAKGTTNVSAAVWYNDTQASRTLTNLTMFPLDSVSIDAVNYWKVKLVRASDTSTTLAVIDTSATAITANTAIVFSPAAIAIAPGDALLVQRAVAGGAPTSLGLMVQGR